MQRLSINPRSWMDVLDACLDLPPSQIPEALQAHKDTVSPFKQQWAASNHVAMAADDPNWRGHNHDGYDVPFRESSCPWCRHTRALEVRIGV